MEDYKTVLIVGNGFDLSLGYRTACSDFMESQYFKQLLSSENGLANYIYNHFQKYGIDNWMDFETVLGGYKPDISTVLGGVNDVLNMYKKFRAEFIILCSALKAYLEKVEKTKKYSKNIENSHAYKLIKEIVNEKKMCYVVNFNYTNIVRELIKKINNNLSNFYIRQIHGSLEHDIVCGIDEHGFVSKEYVFLFKSHNINKDVRGLPLIFENAAELIFFGYSLGETDTFYFDEFFRNQTIKNCHSKSFVFYYYGQDSYDDIIWRLRSFTGGSRLSYLFQYNSLIFKDISKS